MSKPNRFHTIGPIALATVAVICSPQEGSAADKYTAEDLKALVEQESWPELIEHLNDLPPSKRKGEWNIWAETAAIHELDAQSKSAEPMNALGLADGLLKQVPPLKKSRKFMDKRAEVGIAGFKSCFGNRYAGGDCTRLLRAFVALDPENTVLHFEAGKLVRRAMASWTAVEFFVPALKKYNKSRCADKEVEIALIDGLSRETVAAKSVEIVLGVCRKELQKPALKAFYEASASSQVARAMCGPLKAKRLLTPFQTAYCADVK